MFKFKRFFRCNDILITYYRKFSTVCYEFSFPVTFRTLVVISCESDLYYLSVYGYAFNLIILRSLISNLITFLVIFSFFVRFFRVLMYTEHLFLAPNHNFFF